MAKWKVGQKVRIVANTERFHCLAVGTLGTVAEVDEKAGGPRILGINRSTGTPVKQWVKEADVEEYRVDTVDAIYDGLTDGEKKHLVNKIFKHDRIYPAKLREYIPDSVKYPVEVGDVVMYLRKDDMKYVVGVIRKLGPDGALVISGADNDWVPYGSLKRAGSITWEVVA